MATHKDQIAQDDLDAVTWARAIRLAGIALVSAVLTATLVIGMGGAWLDRSAQAAIADIPSGP